MLTVINNLNNVLQCYVLLLQVTVMQQNVSRHCLSRAYEL